MGTITRRSVQECLTAAFLLQWSVPSTREGLGMPVLLTYVIAGWRVSAQCGAEDVHLRMARAVDSVT